MSMQRMESIQCPTCHHSVEIELYQSLSPKRPPHALESILNNTLQATTCSCGQKIRIEPEFIYMDAPNKLCVGAWPSELMPTFKDYEEKAKTSFAAALGGTEIGEGMQIRVTFGWVAFREKVLALQQGIPDVDLEMLKIVMIKQSGEMPNPEQSLRLIDVKPDGNLILGVFQNVAPYAMLGHYELDQELLKTMKTNPEDWAELRATLETGPFVDIYASFFGAE